MNIYVIAAIFILSFWALFSAVGIVIKSEWIMIVGAVGVGMSIEFIVSNLDSKK